MNVKELFLSPTTTIANDYLQHKERLTPYFDYHFKEKDVYDKRKNELGNRTYQREKLMEVLISFQQKFGNQEKAINQIKKLSDPNSLVIVGGQQPGALTGPLYTIYKALTVVQLAKEQENLLGVPVVPLFWIAGEDHDFAEINHLFIKKQEQIEKVEIGSPKNKKIPLTNQQIEKPLLESWLLEVFKSFTETKHTRPLLEKVKFFLERSYTYVDFFGELMSWLFKEEGLVLMDSGDEKLRKLETSLFSEIIMHNEKLHHAFLSQAQKLEQLGYGQPIDVTTDHANLFVIDKGERQKLTRKGDLFIAGTKQWTKTELLAIAEEKPELLSNNVVTRPVMQEFLFPVLAFVAGPGEIAYWATLKEVFHHFSYHVPPLVPRLSLTIVDRQSEKWMEEKQLNMMEVLIGEGIDKKESWLKAQKQWDIDSIGDEVKQQMIEAHRPLRSLAQEIELTVGNLAQKNLTILLSQIDFLTKRLHLEVRRQYSDELKKFDYVNDMLRPMTKPQERIFNIFQLVNLYGVEFVDGLKELELPVNEQHKVIYM